MTAITSLGWKGKEPAKGRTSLQQDCVTTIGSIQRVLQITSGVDGNNVAGSWRVRYSALNVNSGQLCWPIESRRLGRYNRAAHSYRYRR